MFGFVQLIRTIRNIVLIVFWSHFVKPLKKSTSINNNLKEKLDGKVYTTQILFKLFIKSQDKLIQYF